MSTLRVDNLTPAAGGTAYNVNEGVAKVLLEYAQHTPAVNDAVNVSSVDDDAVGVFSVNFTNNFLVSTYKPLGLTVGYQATSQGQRYMSTTGGASADWTDLPTDKTTADCGFIFGGPGSSDGYSWEQIMGRLA